MIAACLLGVGLVVAVPSEDLAAYPPPDLQTFEAARARAGRDSEGHVKLALWCEAHGLRAESVKHLALAILNGPKAVGAVGEGDRDSSGALPTRRANK
jgi:hypothetical protein